MRMLFLFIQTCILLFAKITPGIVAPIPPLALSKSTIRFSKPSNLSESNLIVQKTSTNGGNKKDYALELERMRLKIEKLNKLIKKQNYENARFRRKSQMKEENDELNRKMELKMDHLEEELKKINHRRMVSNSSVGENNFNNSEFIKNALLAIDILKNHSDNNFAQHFHFLIKEYGNLNGEYNPSQIEIVDKMLKEFAIIKKIGNEYGLYKGIQKQWMAMLKALEVEKIEKIENAAGIKV